MTKRLLLEGPEIEELLAQVRDDYGEDARIVSADRVRSGGIAGFFAKQRYELTVEVDDEPPVKAAPSDIHEYPSEWQNNGADRGRGNGGPIGGAGSVEELIALADARDMGAPGERVAHGITPPSAAEEAMRAAAERAERAAAQAAEQAVRPASVADKGLAGRPAIPPGPHTGAGGGIGGGPVPSPGAAPGLPLFQPASVTAGGGQSHSPDGIPFTPAAGFDQVLAALRRDITDQQGAHLLAGTIAPAETAPAAPAEAGPVEQTASIVRPPGSPRPPVPSQSAAPARQAPPTAPLSPHPPATLPASPAQPAEAVPGPAPPAPARAQPPPWEPAVPATPPPSTAEGGRLRSGLLALGLPETWAAGIAETAVAGGVDPYTAIVQAFTALPPAPWPPSRPGDVLVIAGPPDIALDVANRVARTEQLNPHEILLAASTTAGTGVHPSRRISGPADALRRARRMHRADTPHLAVVATSATEDENGDRVRAICDSLGASAVWAVVDATRKTADTRRHLESLGPVHGLAVHGVSVTASPGTVLRLDVPVVYLDGRRVTPAIWAGLLCERLERATT